MKPVFDVGDTVKCILARGDSRDVYDMTGVVCDIQGNRVGVSWDGYTHGHNCSGKCKKGTGWWVDDDVIIAIANMPEEDEQLDSANLL